MPPGSARYWSWLFAAREARPPLLGLYALMAEWRALMDPRTDVEAAHIKLEWWHAEMRRLAAHQALHPICRYLAGLTGADAVDFTPLAQSVEAAAAQVAGAPLENTADLPAHAAALYAIPLQVAARFVLNPLDGGVAACAEAIGQAEYLARAIADYRAEARIGRVPFPVDELLAAEVDNEDLAATVASPRLRTVLDANRLRAAGQYSLAAAALSSAARPLNRHLPVLAALGAAHLTQDRSPSSTDLSMRDLYNAWRAARRAAAGA